MEMIERFQENLYNLYKKYALSFDFKYILDVYLNDYPLLDEELKLFLILISIPDKTVT